MKYLPRVALLGMALVAGACGDSNNTPKDAPTDPADAPIDAPMLPACANPVSGTNVTARLLSTLEGGDSAILVTAPPGDRRLFVVGQSGTINIYKDGALLKPPFLDLSKPMGGPVEAGGEMGLLGLAFHPEYASNGQFFVFFTRREMGDMTYELRDVLARCRVSATDPDRAEPTCTEVLAIKDRMGNHNGGMIEFGPDNYLYIGTGDGGGAGDPDRNAQTLVDGQPTPLSIALLGKMLRIDVNARADGKEYGIPSDNPYAGGGGAPEIFMLGLRNPWRWSFDRATGDLWIADVGQGEYEEVTALRPAQQRGANLGWNMYEGNACYSDPCSPDGKVFPQETRSHSGDQWESITGGQVYRGTCYPDLVGWYFYTDFTKADLFRARFPPSGPFEVVDVAGTFPANPTSIHADAAGELYMTTLDGSFYRLEVTR